MLEPELFALLEHTADAAFTVAADGKVCSWNGSAERLLGHRAGDVLHRHIEEVLDAYDGLGTEPLAGGSQASVRHWDSDRGGIPNFDLDVRTASGERIWVNVSTIIFDNPRTGRRLFVRLARDISQQRRNAGLHQRVLDAARELVNHAEDEAQFARTEPLSEQERRILKLFAGGGWAAGTFCLLPVADPGFRTIWLAHLRRE